MDNEISTTQVAGATYLNNQNKLNISSNVGDGIRQEIEKWDIEMYTLICKLGQLSNDLPASAKKCNYLCGLRNVDNEILTTQVAGATYSNNQN